MAARMIGTHKASFELREQALVNPPGGTNFVTESWRHREIVSFSAWQVS